MWLHGGIGRHTRLRKSVKYFYHNFNFINSNYRGKNIGMSAQEEILEVEQP